MTRRLAAIVSLAVSLANLPLSGAGADTTTFTFHGSAWGHGIGLPQYGAYGLAKKGWSYEQILTHFFTGTTVAQTPFKPARVRVGLIQAQGDIHLKAEAAAVELRLGGPAGTLVAKVPTGKTWTIDVEAGKYKVINAIGQEVGGKLWGSTTEHLFARYAPQGARARITETGFAYARGWMEFNIYGCGGCTKLIRLIANVTPQQYLYGVAEVYSGWPMTALKTQVVTSRTLAFEKIQRLGQHRAVCNCGVFATTSDQVYQGWDKESGSFGGQWVEAVSETLGQVVLHGGKLIEAYFSASSGGYTENNENVWGGSALPYLRGVCDPGDWRADNPYKVWTVTRPGWSAGNMISDYINRDIGNVNAFTNIVRGVSSRIKSVKVDGTLGDATLSGPQFKVALGLKESKVWINVNRNITGAIRERYDLLMCAPGQPTTPNVAIKDGRRQRFQDGALYQNLIRDFVRWLHAGAIYEKYKAMGEAGSVLSVPITGISPLVGTAGSQARFEAGRIYWSSGTGAHALWGAVLSYYLNHGGAGGSLGLPTTDVTVSGGTSSARFQGGTVTCDSGGCTQD